MFFRKRMYFNLLALVVRCGCSARFKGLGALTSCSSSLSWSRRQSGSRSSLSKPFSTMFYIIEGNLQGNLRPTHNEKSLDAKKAERTVKRITFERRGKTQWDALRLGTQAEQKWSHCPGSLALFFNIDLAGGHANNVLVHNVSWALMDKFTVKFAGTNLQDIVAATPTRSLKTFCSQLKTVTTCRWRESKAKNFVRFARTLVSKRQRAWTLKRPWTQFSATSIVLHWAGAPNSGQSLVYYSEALYTDLVFELKLAPASQVVKRFDTTKLVCKLINIHLQYETIHSETFANKVTSLYPSGKAFAYDYVVHRCRRHLQKIKYSCQSWTLIAQVNPSGFHGALRSRCSIFGKIR